MNNCNKIASREQKTAPWTRERRTKPDKLAANQQQWQKWQERTNKTAAKIKVNKINQKQKHLLEQPSQQKNNYNDTSSVSLNLELKQKEDKTKSI